MTKAEQLHVTCMQLMLLEADGVQEKAKERRNQLDADGAEWKLKKWATVDYQVARMH